MPSLKAFRRMAACLVAGGAALTLSACLEDKPGTVQHALAAETKAEKCERLRYLSDERVYWATREKARVAAYELGCLGWSGNA